MLTVVEPTAVPGAFGWPAWEALRRGPVLVGSPLHPCLPALSEAGISWEVVDRPRDGAVWLSGGEELTGPVEVMPSAVPAGMRLLEAVAVMDRLRSPGGCPWDAKQTHESLMPYLLEEAYETYEALENADQTALREELGDLLLQILFHARIADGFGIDEVSGDLVDKLVRRHPHVFAGASPDDLEGSWDRLKQAEKGRTSVTEGVPLGQPALALAAKLQRRAGKLGAPTVAFDGLGGRLWELVALCQEAGLDPEVELRTVARSFRDRLASLERAGLPSTVDGWHAAFA